MEKEFKFIAKLKTETRGGKVVTLIDDLPKQEIFLRDLAAELKKKCGSGGTYDLKGKEGRIEIQGDKREMIRTLLEKKGINVKLSLLLIFGLALGCGSHPVVPKGEDVKVSREKADSDCKEIGIVQGNVPTRSGTVEQAIENMKTDAARKGANYVQMGQTSALGTTVSGTAYKCE